jgi:D-inositol-3-phosphate glycosyltransferase
MSVYIRELSRELGRRGVEVDVFTRRHRPDEPEVIPLGEKARLIHLAAGDPRALPKQNLLRFLPQFIQSWRHFRHRHQLRYDLVHSHYWLSAWAAEQVKSVWKLPHLVTFHTLGRIKLRACPRASEAEVRLEMEGKILAAADRVLAFTQEEKEEMVRLYGVPADKIEVIPCGVDLELFRPLDKAEARRRLGFPEQHLFLFVGRIDPLKGLDLLLPALSSLNGEEWRLLVVGGDGQDREEIARLSSLADRMGIGGKVTFLGTVEQRKLPLFYNAASLCVVPSYYESFGLVALEALACGTPVVASQVGGLAVTLRDGENGCLVSHLHPQAFAQRLKLLLHDEPLRRKLGAAGRASVEQYKWSTVADQVLKLYRSLLAPYQEIQERELPG